MDVFSIQQTYRYVTSLCDASSKDEVILYNEKNLEIVKSILQQSKTTFAFSHLKLWCYEDLPVKTKCDLPIAM